MTRFKGLRIDEILVEMRIFILIGVLFIILGFVAPSFYSVNNFLSVFQNISLEGIIMIGMTLLIIMCEMDLSVGAVMSFSCYCCIMFQPHGVIPAVLVALAASAFVGLMNGVIVIKAKVSSIPATLGMMVLINGLVFLLTGNKSIPGQNENFIKIAGFKMLGISMLIWIFIILVIIFAIILARTKFGRDVYAVGGNKTAALFSGISPERIKIIVFILTGVLAGVAGIMMASKLNIASGLLGQQTAFMVITAVLLGGVSLGGGEGSIPKALQGMVLIGLLSNAMQFLKLPNPLQSIITGSILIAILATDAIKIRKRQFE